MKMNSLYYGDNLVWLKDKSHFPDNSVDLIYLDPPFNSKADYNILFREPNGGNKSQAQIRAFDDTWHWDTDASQQAHNELTISRPDIAEFINWLSRQGNGHNSIAAYLSMMAVRLLQLQRILKPTGGIYLHCDWHANAYLRILMDLIFKERNFNNEIIWHYHSGGASSKRWARKHATILFYGNGEPTRFNTIYEPYNAIIAPKRQHLFNPKGKGADDVFNIAMLSTVSKERLGYPTQKPLTLLERIITASSNEGDVVLDPFCGCGTTIDAAQKLKRHWIGIDVTWLAITEIEGRLINTYGEDIKNKYDVCGSPADLSSAKELFKKSAKEFEIWAITKVPAHPREHDGGVDGICGFPERDGSVKTIVVQVKGGGMLNPGMVRDLIGTVKNENAAIGLMITLNKPTKGMKELAIHSEPYKSDLWEREYPSIQILTVEEILNGINFDLPTKIAPFKQALRIKERAEANKLL